MACAPSTVPMLGCCGGSDRERCRSIQINMRFYGYAALTGSNPLLPMYQARHSVETVVSPVYGTFVREITASRSAPCLINEDTFIDDGTPEFFTAKNSGGSYGAVTTISITPSHWEYTQTSTGFGSGGITTSHVIIDYSNPISEQDMMDAAKAEADAWGLSSRPWGENATRTRGPRDCAWTQSLVQYQIGVGGRCPGSSGGVVVRNATFNAWDARWTHLDIETVEGWCVVEWTNASKLTPNRCYGVAAGGTIEMRENFTDRYSCASTGNPPCCVTACNPLP